jgi:hypothetical protein
MQTKGSKCGSGLGAVGEENRFLTSGTPKTASQFETPFSGDGFRHVQKCGLQIGAKGEDI